MIDLEFVVLVFLFACCAIAFIEKVVASGVKKGMASDSPKDKKLGW